MRGLILVFVSVTTVFWQHAVAAPAIADADLRQAVEDLSGATLVGGEGWQSYDRLLHGERPAQLRGAFSGGQGRRSRHHSLQDDGSLCRAGRPG